tara:strand:- start:528 stop:881 length:354 start_codon:yes stop_codon:yes gene_type:complete
VSLITRGLGPEAKLITQGFGPPIAEIVVAKTIILDGIGRSSKLYDHLAENLYVKKYLISARLISVNGVPVHHINDVKFEGKNDERHTFRVNLDQNVYVKKTNPESNIFINILNFFKR